MPWQQRPRSLSGQLADKCPLTSKWEWMLRIIETHLRLASGILNNGLRVRVDALDCNSIRTFAHPSFCPGSSGFSDRLLLDNMFRIQQQHQHPKSGQRILGGGRAGWQDNGLLGLGTAAQREESYRSVVCQALDPGPTKPAWLVWNNWVNFTPLSK